MDRTWGSLDSSISPFGGASSRRAPGPRIMRCARAPWPVRADGLDGDERRDVEEARAQRD
jgi:hypothetical protein